MSSFTLARKAVFVLILALVAIPALSLADVYTCYYPYTTNCSQGTLHVYVVSASTSGPQTKYPSDFTVVVHAQNPVPATFRGSQSGVNVTLFGSYTVEALSDAYYTPTYSQGCKGSISSSNEETCTVTMSPTSVYSNTPIPFAYPYGLSYPYNSLTCSPGYQTVALGQSARFTAVGNSGPYSWSTPVSSYPAQGPVFTTTLRQTGEQTVTVTSGSQTAVCTVNVLAQGSAVYPYQSNVTPLPVWTTPSPTVSPTIVTQYVPALPNTGFGPKTATQIALALVALIAAAIALTPYVRKTTNALIG